MTQQDQAHVLPPTRGTESRHEAIAGAVARGWCSPENASKVMDSDLALAIVAEVEAELARRGRAQGGNTSDNESLDLAAKAPAAQAVDAATLLNSEELAALRRFDECAQDGEGYDVPKEMMQRLAKIGVVRRKSGAYYEHTEFGQYALSNTAGAARQGGITSDEWPTPADILAENLDNIAEYWTECMYDAPGGSIDIGASLRAEFAKLDITAHAAPSAAAGEPIGYISRDTLAKLQGPDLAADESARLWHAENPPSRAVVPVFLAHPAAPVQPVAVPAGQDTRPLIANLAQIVYTQNGNLHADINELLDQAKQWLASANSAEVTHD